MIKRKVHLTPDNRLTRKDASTYLGISVKALSERHRKGLPPRSIKVASRRFYYLSELEAFVAQGTNR
jgi:hypothetical protein